jgi:hypothetical protein
VKADMLSPSARYASQAFATVPYAASLGIATPAAAFPATGMVHVTSEVVQDETVGFDVNHIVFTSTTDVDEFNQINPKSIFIAEWNGLQFAFSKRATFSQQSGLWHYQGDALYPSMATQVVNSLADLDLGNPVVSNSLPIWLTLNRFCPMYPSFLVPDDIAPPWCTVHIDPESTQALQATPYVDPCTGSQYQLCRDVVRLTTYGLKHNEVMDLMQYIFAYMSGGDVLGLMNTPVVRDEKAMQIELNVLAQKKTIEFEVNYYQSRIRSVARKYVTQAIMSVPPFQIMGFVGAAPITFYGSGPILFTQAA